LPALGKLASNAIHFFRGRFSAASMPTASMPATSVPDGNESELQDEIDRLWKEMIEARRLKAAKPPAPEQLLEAVGFGPNGSSLRTASENRWASGCWRPVLRDHSRRWDGPRKEWPTIRDLLADPRVMWFDCRHEVQQTWYGPTVQSFTMCIFNAWGDFYRINSVVQYVWETHTYGIAAHCTPLRISRRSDSEPYPESEYARLLNLEL